VTRSNPSEIAKAGDLPGFPSLTDQQPQRFVAQALYVMAGLTAVGFILVLTFRGFRRRLLIEPVLLVLLSLWIGDEDHHPGIPLMALVVYALPIVVELAVFGVPDPGELVPFFLWPAVVLVNYPLAFLG